MSSGFPPIMSNASPEVASRPKIPGEAGIWMLILGDMAVFAIFFVVYMSYRAQEIPLFQHSQEMLSRTDGLINTILLLSSSYFVAGGVKKVRSGALAPASRLFAMALACGVGFVGIKAFEWTHEVQAGALPTSNNFFMFYFVLTGIHLMHLLLGLLVLAFLVYTTRASAAAPSQRLIECGASFWHLVDVLWVVLFPMLYLLR